ncbi:20996_t:CDS:2, partial [Gigaspora rosea]
MSNINATTSSSTPTIYRSSPTTSSNDLREKSPSPGSQKLSSKVSKASSPTSSLPTRRPRTSASSRVAGRGESHSFIVSIIEGRGVASEVGMCFIDLKTSECILSQIADSQTYVKTLHKLNIYNPAEILLSATAVEPSKSKLCKILEDNMPTATIVPIGRKYFNDAA